MPAKSFVREIRWYLLEQPEPINAQELRIGNIVISYGKEQKISAVDFAVFQIYEIKGELPPYVPIPLTEEWLLKFGFEEDNYTYIKGVHQKIFSGIMKFEFNESLKNWEFSIGRYNDLTRVEYVHQLQNLYYALTGEELIINQSDCV
jgi:hypothetical protein